MDDSQKDVRRELAELMQRMRREHFAPPIPEGVTPAEVRVVMTINQLERISADIRPGKVAEMTHTTPSALSQTLKALEEKGLIERHRAGGDYRAVSVVLTDEGRRFADEGKRLCNEHLDMVCDYVGVDDMRHLVRILKKVADFHESMADEGRLMRVSCRHAAHPGCGQDGEPCA